MNLSLFLFLIGILGFILNRKNIILMIIAIEIMLLAVTLLVLISSFSFDDGIGQTFSIFIISIAGAESVIGLSILVAFYRSFYLKVVLIFNWGFNIGSSDKNLVYFLSGKYSNKYKSHKLVTPYLYNRKYSTRSNQNIISKGQTIKIGQKSLRSIISNTQTKTMVPYGQHQGNTIGLRLSQNMLNSLYLTQIQRDIIIGIMLGDCHIKKMSGLKNGAPMIQYNQGFVHLPYILFLFQFLAPLCTHYPSLIQRKDGTFYVQFYSRCLSALNPVYDLFVKEGVKTIPNNIADILSAQSLAFWCMDDGSISESGFYLNTHSYTFKEQIVLQNALKYKFNIDTNVHKHGNKYKLYIKAKSMPILRYYVLPYFCNFFYYKLYRNYNKPAPLRTLAASAAVCQGSGSAGGFRGAWLQ